MHTGLSRFCACLDAHWASLTSIQADPWSCIEVLVRVPHKVGITQAAARRGTLRAIQLRELLKVLRVQLVIHAGLVGCLAAVQALPPDASKEGMRLQAPLTSMLSISFTSTATAPAAGLQLEAVKPGSVKDVPRAAHMHNDYVIQCAMHIPVMVVPPALRVLAASRQHPGQTAGCMGPPTNHVMISPSQPLPPFMREHTLISAAPAREPSRSSASQSSRCMRSRAAADKFACGR